MIRYAIDDLVGTSVRDIGVVVGVLWRLDQRYSR
jgi:dTDP-glucose pyrophosphorylase